MSEQLLLSLLITLIGMGLVFGAIILLWMLLGLLVKLTGKSISSQNNADTPGRNAKETLLKKRAAVAAVAVALALRETKDEPHEFPLPPTAIVSAWQAVLRSNILNKRGQSR